MLEEQNIGTEEAKLKKYIGELLTKVKADSTPSTSKVNDPFIPITEITELDTMLIKKYSLQVYLFNLKIDSKIPSNYLSRRSLSPQIRFNMINTMINIFDSYNSEPSTFFLAVQIFDNYLWKSTQVISNDDLVLICLVSVFIASKMEDIIPLHMIHIKTKIGHDRFSEELIKKIEIDILETLDFGLIMSNTYDFLRTYIYDFCLNNKEKIRGFEMVGDIQAIEHFCIKLCKLITLSDVIQKYNHSFQAIGCLIAGFEIYKMKMTNLSLEKKELLRQWTNFIIKANRLSNKSVNELFDLCKKIINFYQEMKG